MEQFSKKVLHLLAHLYESIGSYCCQPDTMGITLKVLQQRFLCDGQGPLRQVILYVNMACCKTRVYSMISFLFLFQNNPKKQDHDGSSFFGVFS